MFEFRVCRVHGGLVIDTLMVGDPRRPTRLLAGIYRRRATAHQLEPIIPCPVLAGASTWTNLPLQIGTVSFDSAQHIFELATHLFRPIGYRFEGYRVR